MHLHALALPAQALIAWGLADGDLGEAGRRFAGLLGMLAAVLLHELAHGVVARARGLAVLDVRVHAVGGVARIERPPAAAWRPADEWGPALAGPLGNLAVAAVTLGVASAAGVAFPWGRAAPSAWGRDPLAAFFAGNVALGVANLLPVFPSDGGRVLRALLAGATSYRTATRVAVGVGALVAAAATVALVRVSGPRVLPGVGLVLTLLALYGSVELRSLAPRETLHRFHRFVAACGPSVPLLAALPRDPRGLPVPDPAVLDRPEVAAAFAAWTAAGEPAAEGGVAGR